MSIPSIGIIRRIVARESFALNCVRLGQAIPVIFWATTIICGFIIGDYNHLSRMVSELGAIGTGSRYVFSAGLLLCSLLSVVLVVGLILACRANGMSNLPVILMLSYSISIAGAAIFPLPLKLHLIMGIPSVLLVFSPLIALFLWAKTLPLPRFRTMSLLSLFVMSLGFLAFDPNTFSGYVGLKQRLFHLGWSIWFIYLGYGFSKVGVLPNNALRLTEPPVEYPKFTSPEVNAIR